MGALTRSDLAMGMSKNKAKKTLDWLVDGFAKLTALGLVFSSNLAYAVY